MANIGIIAEFNPFHTGHKYLIDTVKGADDTVICVMSGNFVQRGDVAIVNKSVRVSAALKNGADLIIELPTSYALSTAQRFARGGVSLLNHLGVIDKICFGSECGDINKLNGIADLLLSDSFNSKLNSRLKSGDTFAKIRTDILAEFSPEYSEILKSPNNILGIEYILAARELGLNPQFQTVTRTGAGHDSPTASSTASASYIREAISNSNSGTIVPFLPDSGQLTNNYANIKNLETAILASLRFDNSPARYADLPDISEGIENRIAEAVRLSSTLTELYENIKTKRYTLSRIRRIILCAFLGITTKLSAAPPQYIRVLGFTKKGEDALKEIAKKSDLPIVCTASDAAKLYGIAADLFRLECKASDLWSLSLNYPQNCGNEYFYKIVKE